MWIVLREHNAIIRLLVTSAHAVALPPARCEQNAWLAAAPASLAGGSFCATSRIESYSSTERPRSVTAFARAFTASFKTRSLSAGGAAALPRCLFFFGIFTRPMSAAAPPGCFFRGLFGCLAGRGGGAWALARA